MEKESFHCSQPQLRFEPHFGWWGGGQLETVKGEQWMGRGRWGRGH